jgi:hypothetical protein
MWGHWQHGALASARTVPVVELAHRLRVAAHRGRLSAEQAERAST